MVEIPEIKKLEEDLEARLGGAWQEAMNQIRAGWKELEEDGNLNLASALLVVTRILLAWPEITFLDNQDFLRRIYSVSFMAGAVDTEVKVVPNEDDLSVLEWINHAKNGFLPSLDHLSEDAFKTIEKELKAAYSKEGVFELDIIVNKIIDATADLSKSRAELIVRTETAKISALGRIFAWGKDRDRDYYDYWWIASNDDRVKDISLKFERNGPYSFDRMRTIWEVDHQQPQLVRNRKTGNMEYQISAFNCRCSVARTPKRMEKLISEGLIHAPHEWR